MFQEASKREVETGVEARYNGKHACETRTIALCRGLRSLAGRIRDDTLTLSISYPFVALVTVIVSAGQLLVVRRLSRFSGVDAAIGLLSTALTTITVTCWLMLAKALAALAGPHWLATATDTLLLLLAGAFLADHFSYRWLSLHLHDTAFMLFRGLRADFTGMRRKALALAGFLAITCAGAVLLVLMLEVVEAGHPEFVPSVPAGSAVALVLGVTVVLLAVRWLSPRLMSPLALQVKTELLWPGKLLIRPRRRVGPDTHSVRRPRFKALPTEARIRSALETLTPANVRRELSVFVLVVDSLRRDFITPEVMPALHRFRSQAMEPVQALASSNCTHTSWVAMAHSVNPIHWSVMVHQRKRMGAIPIRALKRAGYGVHAFATPRLDYFGFSRSTFGENLALADTYWNPSIDGTGMAGGCNGDLDRLTMDQLLKSLEGAEPGARSSQFCFFHGAHHDYQWPRDFRPPFEPYWPATPLWPGAVHPGNVELLRNRYRNALRAIDDQLARFFEALVHRNLLDTSLVVVTSDHGEEFLEEGMLTHASQLNRPQLEVPLIFHLPAALRSAALASSPPPIGSHVDVFPTILHALGLDQPVNALLAGRSLLSATPPEFAFAASCSSFTPSRLLLDLGTDKAMIVFDGIRKFGSTLYARRMEVEKILDANHRAVPPGTKRHVISEAELDARVQAALATIIETAPSGPVRTAPG